MDDRSHRGENAAEDKFFFREKDTFHEGTTAFREEKIAPPDVETRPRSRLRPIVLFGLAVLLALATYRFVTSNRGPAESSRIERETAPQPVGAATIGVGDIKVIVNALGTVTPLATVTVKTQVNGQLTEVAFKEGQSVKKGDFLAQIDPRPYQLAEAQFEGQLVHDQGLLDQARDGPDPLSTPAEAEFDRASAGRGSGLSGQAIRRLRQDRSGPDRRAEAEPDLCAHRLADRRPRRPAPRRPRQLRADNRHWHRGADPVASDLGDFPRAGGRSSRRSWRR